MAVRRGRLIGAAVFAAGLLVCAPARSEQVHPEQDVKAAFLFNFTRFVTWPTEIPAGTEPFRLCVVADSAAIEAVERTMAGESVNGRAVLTLTPRSTAQARECQILFVGRSAAESGAPLLAAVRELPVLTVGDEPRFLARGGTIQFVVEDGRVRFDVSVANAERARLEISSRLLRVARAIVEGRPR